MWWFEGPDELAGLLVVSVGGERDVVHRHLQLQLLPRHGGDLLGLRHDVLQRAQNTTVSSFNYTIIVSTSTSDLSSFG